MDDPSQVPVITLIFVAGAVLTSLAVQCRFVTPFQLFYASKPVFQNGQLWRLITNFLYFGPLSLDFCFHLFFFVRYSKMLESNAFHGRKADYLWLLIVSATILLILSPLSPPPFLSSPLSFTLVYLWSRLNPNVRLSLFGILQITAPHLPYALVIFSWALNNSWTSVIGDLLGIFAGHFWYFFTTIWKEERASGARNWLETPVVLVRLMDGLDLMVLAVRRGLGERPLP